MGITVNKLNKLTSKLIREGHGRKVVHVNKNTFTHDLEQDGCIVLPVETVEINWIPTIDDNGRFKENQNGSESGKTLCVLRGDKD